jgi:putative sugar O-methyltransferase
VNSSVLENESLQARDWQVEDDAQLLGRMMTDLMKAPEMYRPTNYWSYYERTFLPELQRKGLRDFRRRRHSILDSFGAVDLPLEGHVRLRPQFRGARIINRIIGAFFDAAAPLLKVEIDYVDPRTVIEYAYRYVQAKFERIDLDLARCPTTRFGRPLDAHEIDGGTWSLSHLQYCSMFADAAQHMKLGQTPVLCELGTGMGRNVEVLAKLFPAATIFAIDIPPQLYVAHQYLSKVFPNRTVHYDDSIRMAAPSRVTGSAVQGKIVLMPSWRMPAWSATKIDLFWNSASFQEMEPDVATNYLKLVLEMAPEWIYINALPRGNYYREWKSGRGGTKKPVLAQYYADTLDPAYENSVTYDTDYLSGRVPGYLSYIFKRRQHST